MIVQTASRHYALLETADGTWVSVTDGTLTVQGHVDDGAIWEADNGAYRHAVTGFHLEQALRRDRRVVGLVRTEAWARAAPKRLSRRAT